MSRTVTNRHVAGIVSAALALGVAAPAAARSFDLNDQGSYVPVTSAQTQAPSATADHASGGGISDLGYVAIGSGAASLMLIGVGGTRVAGRRRQQRITAQQPTIAA
jgi:hypothetical protein